MPDAFEDWYVREYPRVLAAVTVHARDGDLAEEVTAEAFVRALERWERVSGMRSAGGWVHRVAMNLLRRRKRRRGLEAALLQRDRVDVPPASPEVDPALWQAVRALPRRMREAVALRYIADLTEAEVAERMGIAPGTVAATLHRARGRLAAGLDLATTPEAHDG